MSVRLALLLPAPCAALAGCALLDQLDPPRSPDLTCRPDGRFAFLDTSPDIYRQGAAIALRPMVDVSPAGQDELPAHCARAWTVSGPARLSADRRTLTIDPSAPVGAQIEVGFLWRGERVVARLAVVARDAVVLTGRWSQRSAAGCESADPVREFELRPDGSFSVTFQPFETYRDYWGRYRFDPATGRLSLAVEEGNFVPPGLDQEGTAALAGGRLTLTGFFLGSRNGFAPPAGGCTYHF